MISKTSILWYLYEYVAAEKRLREYILSNTLPNRLIYFIEKENHRFYYTKSDVRFDITIALIRLTNCLPLTTIVVIGQVT